MSLATVHYLSMNVHSGRVTVPTVTHGVSATFTEDSVAPSTSHTIIWGDGSGNSVVTSDSSGNISTTHTYAAAGTFQMQVTETTGGRVVGSHSVVVA